MKTKIRIAIVIGIIIGISLDINAQDTTIQGINFHAEHTSYNPSGIHDSHIRQWNRLSLALKSENNSFRIEDWRLGSSNVKTIFTANANGNIGIGTTSPEGNLQIGSSTQNGMLFLGGGKGYSGIGATRSDGGLVLGWNIYARYNDASDNWKARVGKTNSHQGYSGIKITQQGVIDFFGYRGAVTADEIANTDQSIKMRIDKYGNIGIGTINPNGWKLAVNGNIRAKEIKVETGWSDFVFEKNYDLPTLQEVENYIKEKGHLKDIPSAKDVEKNGIFLGEMDSKLLQKIEELTLYTIQQQKEIEELKLQNKILLELQKRLEKLEKK